MPSDRVVERRRVYQQYKADVKERGKPFFPYAMFHDTVMSLVVVVVIIGLAVVWKYTTPGNHTGTGAGWLGKLLDAPADPGTINFVPRPDWYFYFLFYLLRIFKWPHTVILGTIGIPTICLVLLLAMPFIDTRAERRLSRRPGRDHRVDPRRPLDGHPHVQGRDREGSARLRVGREDPVVGEDPGLHREPAGDRRSEAVRGLGLPELPHLPRCRRRLPGRAEPVGEGREEQGHRLPGRPSQEPRRA